MYKLLFKNYFFVYKIIDSQNFLQSMVYNKRKRNVKISNDVNHKVIKQEELNIAQLDDYVPPSLDTGMEAEEEKEIHLKNIIEVGKGDIPLPVIITVDNPARQIYGSFKQKKKYMFFNEDAKNKYILDEEDKKLCGNSNISEDIFIKTIEDVANGVQAESKLEENISDVVLPKIIVREEGFKYPSYVCFRKRVIKPNRRSRRSEENAKEKLEKLWSELYLLNELCELKLEKTNIEKKYEDVSLDICTIAQSILNSTSRSGRKKIVRMILKKPDTDKKDGLFASISAFGNLMFDRTRIRALRKRLAEIKEGKSIDEIECEAQALKRYNEAHVCNKL